MSEQLAPAGLHDAIIFDVQDLGEVQTAWGIMPKVQLCFSLWNNGKFYYVPRPYSFKLGSRSHLVRDLESLLGYVPSQDFDLSRLVDLRCQLHLSIERLADGRMRNRILGILPARPEQENQINQPTPKRRFVPVPIRQRKAGSMA